MGLVLAVTFPSLVAAPSTRCRVNHAAQPQPDQDPAPIAQSYLMARSMRTTGAMVIQGGLKAPTVQVRKVSTADQIED